MRLHLPLKGGGRQAQRAGRGSHFASCQAILLRSTSLNRPPPQPSPFQGEGATPATYAIVLPSTGHRVIPRSSGQAAIDGQTYPGQVCDSAKPGSQKSSLL